VNNTESPVKQGVKRITVAQRPAQRPAKIRKVKQGDNVTVIVMKDDDNNEEDTSSDTAIKETSSLTETKLDTWSVSDSGSDKIKVLNNITRKKDVMECHVCSDTFDMVAAMKRHYSELHPDTKPFSCDLCNKRFDRKENLSRHVRIHTGDRRYVCNHCGKGYTDPSGLKKHVIAKHASDLYSCDVCCNATFRSKDSLNRHLSKHLETIKDAITDNASKLNKVDDGSERVVIEVDDIEAVRDENTLDHIGNVNLIVNEINDDIITGQPMKRYVNVKKELTDAVTEIIITAAQHDQLTQQQQQESSEASENIEEDMLQLQQEDQFVMPVEMTAQHVALNIASPQQKEKNSPAEVVQQVISQDHLVTVSITTNQEIQQTIPNLGTYISTTTSI